MFVSLAARDDFLPPGVRVCGGCVRRNAARMPFAAAIGAFAPVSFAAVPFPGAPFPGMTFPGVPFPGVRVLALPFAGGRFARLPGLCLRCSGVRAFAR